MGRKSCSRSIDLESISPPAASARFDVRFEAAEQAVRFIFNTGGKVEFICVAPSTTVPEGKGPQTLEDDVNQGRDWFPGFFEGRSNVEVTIGTYPAPFILSAGSGASLIAPREGMSRRETVCFGL
jgi:hypothetical protein